MSFTALVVRKNGDTLTEAIEVLDDDSLPQGDVTVAVEYSTVNYKDGLCLAGMAGLVRNYPHVPGIDFAGRVIASDDARYKPGDAVVLTGWRVGELHWGGYATRARVKGDWLVPLPAELSPRRAMAIGTAGLTAMLAVMALEHQGLDPKAGPVLVTGASGGVGSVATAILANLGYQVAALTGRRDNADYLRHLGASQIVDRADLADPNPRPLEGETWAGCVDTVGGTVLARALAQMKYGASVAAVGLAGGADLPTTVMPFILRDVNLLGIDSVMQPYARRAEAWQRLGRDLPMDLLDDTIVEVALSEVPAICRAILQGQVKGRTVVALPRD